MARRELEHLEQHIENTIHAHETGDWAQANIEAKLALAIARKLDDDNRKRV